eukprot:1009856-Alexandrium_andersonii.AAC.1
MTTVAAEVPENAQLGSGGTLPRGILGEAGGSSPQGVVRAAEVGRSAHPNRGKHRACTVLAAVALEVVGL